MKTEETDIWKAKNELPHDQYMDDHGIHFSMLPSAIKDAIIALDTVYEKALAEGFIDQKEERKIFQESERITQLINNHRQNIEL